MQKPLTSRALQLVVALLAAAVLTIAHAASPSAPEAGAAPRHRATTPPTWPFSAIDIPADRPAGDDVRVAIVDSGVDVDHPAFRGRVVAAVDCVGSGGDVSECTRGARDDNGHGTHIAGIVAARSVGGGPEGVAPRADILAIRSLSNTCEGDVAGRECRALGELDDVVAGVRVATARDAQVINLSIDAGVELDWKDGDLADAVADAWAAGAVVVASTGNRSITIDDPHLGEVPLVLVGAIGPDGSRASYSNEPRTARWSFLAPGGEAGGRCPDEGVLSTYPIEIEAAGTGCLSGTSMAAAYVSGALASLISSGLDPHTALAHLLATAAETPDGPVVDLESSLATPASGPDASFTRGVASSQLGETTTNHNAVFSASGLPLEEWTRAHPLRTRAAGTLAIAAGVVLMLVSRRRSPLFHV